MALALSPSSTFTYLVGSAVLGWGGDAERAIEWAERALRLSPFDPWNWFACNGLALGHFRSDTMGGGHRCPQVNPLQSTVQHVLHAACGFISEAGKVGEAKVRPPVFWSATLL